jgi:hypothetical protein
VTIEGNEGIGRFFHSTTTSAAEAILARGFRDGEGRYGFGIWLRGVFLADRPVDENFGAHSEVLLEVGIPVNIDLSPYEIVDETGDCREWCIPASVINEHAEVRQVEKDEADDLNFLLGLPRDWPDPCPACGGALQLVDSPAGFRDEIEIGQCLDCGLERHRRKP